LALTGLPGEQGQRRRNPLLDSVALKRSILRLRAAQVTRARDPTTKSSVLVSCGRCICGIRTTRSWSGYYHSPEYGGWRSGAIFQYRANHTAMGFQALMSNTLGTRNTACGANALVNNTDRRPANRLQPLVTRLRRATQTVPLTR